MQTHLLMPAQQLACTVKMMPSWPACPIFWRPAAPLIAANLHVQAFSHVASSALGGPQLCQCPAESLQVPCSTGLCAEWALGHLTLPVHCRICQAQVSTQDWPPSGSQLTQCQLASCDRHCPLGSSCCS